MGLHYAPEKTGNAPYTTALASRLKSLGHDVHVLTSHPHYPEWKVRAGYGQWLRRETIRGVPVRRFAHFVPREPSAAMRLLSELSFGARLLFTRWGNPDVVLLVSPALFSTVLPVMRARWGFRRPAVGVWVQDLYSLGVVETGAGGGRVARVVAAIESFTLRSASGVSVIHDRFKQVVVSKLGMNAREVVVIRNWSHLQEVPPFDREAVRSLHGWGRDETIVLHAGNMGAKQALENVIEAARIADQRGLNVRFVLLGDGNQRARLEALAAGTERVQFLKTLPDENFQQALGSADVLLVNEKPGVAEMSVPSKLTSYFSTGLPVLAATDEGSVTAGEVAASGGGIRVDAGNPGQLVDAVLTLGGDEALAGALGTAGRLFREQSLSEDAAVQRYAEWLTSLANGRGR
jgi:glycosyltransferase involved in cell wall biosynthesis